MKKNIQAACLQLNANEDFNANLKRAYRHFQKALKQGANLITFPETFFWRGPRKDMRHMACDVSGAIIDNYRKQAKKEGVAILLGSVIEPSPQKGKYSNTSVLISEKGKVTKYRKIHLFDIGIKGKVEIKESAYSYAGEKIVTAEVLGVRVGLSICYDLRFPELYREFAARGAKIAFVPANFSKHTGRAHWHVLLRARAIENQMFVIAPGQSGMHPSTGIESYGHSMIIDPWGQILAEAGAKGETVISSRLDLQKQKELRQALPVLRHRRL